MGAQPRWAFGNEPLPEVVDLAVELRELLNAVLALEAAPPELADLTARIRTARDALARSLPADLAPRIGDAATDAMRVYVDHSRDIGTYHPAFPVYDLRCVDDRAEGEVTFPIVYEGPPGVVHGGFLALFFDCVLQQLNCDMGLAGKTTRLALRYRRPTPLDRPLRVVASRVVEDDRIHSEAQLLDGDADQGSRELARGLLGVGVGRGAHVALCYPTGVDFVTAWLACARIGAVTVPMSGPTTAW